MANSVLKVKLLDLESVTRLGMQSFQQALWNHGSEYDSETPHWYLFTAAITITILPLSCHCHYYCYCVELKFL